MNSPYYKKYMKYKTKYLNLQIKQKGGILTGIPVATDPDAYVPVATPVSDPSPGIPVATPVDPYASLPVAQVVSPASSTLSSIWSPFSSTYSNIYSPWSSTYTSVSKSKI